MLGWILAQIIKLPVGYIRTKKMGLVASDQRGRHALLTLLPDECRLYRDRAQPGLGQSLIHSGSLDDRHRHL